MSSFWLKNIDNPYNVRYYIDVVKIQLDKQAMQKEVFQLYGMTLVYVNHLVESGKGYLWDDLMKVTKLFIEANQEQNS